MLTNSNLGRHAVKFVLGTSSHSLPFGNSNRKFYVAKLKTNVTGYQGDISGIFLLLSAADTKYLGVSYLLGELNYLEN